MLHRGPGLARGPQPTQAAFVSDEPSAPGVSPEPRLGVLAPPAEVLMRGVDAEALEDAVLLLSALGVPHEIVGDGDGVALVVDAAQAELARRELVDLDRGELTMPPAPVLHGGATAGVATAVALLAGHLWIMLRTPARRAAIYAAGELDATRVHAGEAWRAVTALTLHADPAHVVGNAVATAIFVSAVGDWVGPGLALFLTVLAGIIGNLLAAWLDIGHRAIGFSTATFGALGLSAVFGFVARYRDRIARRRAWLTLGAGVALLALLGAGERSDVLAHVLGLVAGAGLATVIARTTRPVTRTNPIVQLGFAALSVAIVAGAWACALPSAR